MRVNVVHDGETYLLQCGSGMQRVSWVARVAAQRLGSGGVWCPVDKEVGRPTEYIPGRVFHPDGEEIDTEANIASLVESSVKDDADLTLVVELRDKPLPGLPSLAAKGSEDSVVPPKNSKAAVSYSIDISDITKGDDKMILDAIRNVLMNNFASLVDIFLFYTKSKQVQGIEVEGTERVINMKKMATFVRTCRLSSEQCSFFEIQRACVRPSLLLPTEDESSLGIYDADFNLHQFLEALIRISHLKGFGLSATCDQLNKLINTQILPYATGDEEDRIRELIQDVKVQAIFAHTAKQALRKFFTKRMKLEKPTGARSISLGEFISALKISEQLDDELTPAAVKEVWLATLSFDVRPDLISEDDNTLEVALSEFEEIITRCVLQKFKTAEDNLAGQTDLFIKKFLRQNAG